MAATEIIANPVQLRKQAEEISKCTATYRTSLGSANSQVNSLHGIWTGAAADSFHTGFQKLYAQCNEGLATLARMVNALYESADAYERNEKAVQTEASKLPKLPNNTMR